MAPRSLCSLEHLERVRPLVADEAGDAPEHAQRLDGAGGFGLAHIGRFPTELIENPAHDFLRRVVVATDEHRWFPAFEFRIDHAGVADGIEGLDEPRVCELLLEALHERLVEIGEES